MLWTFSGGGDGLAPIASLIADGKGALYGTTSLGGPSSSVCFFGSCGVVFKLTPPKVDDGNWSETVLWSFSGADGFYVPSGLFSFNDSPSRKKTVYGTTFGGGSGNCPGIFGGCGTVFKLQDGLLTTLWNFSGGSDGAGPGAGLIADEDTNTLYGTASGGGSQSCSGGCGTVFAIDKTSGALTTIWTFSGPDGAGPGGPLLIRDGALYGTAGGGSRNCFCGTIFKLTPPVQGQTSWNLTTLYSFSGGSDGAGPNGPLIADDSGALFGAASSGGSGGIGVVFKLTPPAAEQPLGLKLSCGPLRGVVMGAFRFQRGSSPIGKGRFMGPPMSAAPSTHLYAPSLGDAASFSS